MLSRQMCYLFPLPCNVGFGWFDVVVAVSAVSVSKRQSLRCRLAINSCQSALLLPFSVSHTHSWRFYGTISHSNTNTLFACFTQFDVFMYVFCALLLSLNCTFCLLSSSSIISGNWECLRLNTTRLAFRLVKCDQQWASNRCCNK